MNYEEISDAIINYANRSNDFAFISNIQLWISMVEGELNRSLRSTDQEVRAAIEVATQYIQLPEDVLELRNIQMNTSRGTVPLEAMSPQQIDTEAASSVGIPSGYTVIGAAIQLDCAPSSNVSIEIAYYAKIPELTSEADNNWLSSKAPDAYIFGALSHANAWLADDDRIQLWAIKFDQIKNDLQTESERLKYQGGSMVQRLDPLYVV